MEFKHYQEEAAQFAIYKDKVTYPVLGLASEAGEVCGKIKKVMRDETPMPLDDLKAELGDVLWYIAAICTDLNIDLSEVAKQNIEKLQNRKNRGKIQGSGDNR